jgi:pimeloyl-ACP methyl ester carboxylesterase
VIEQHELKIGDIRIAYQVTGDPSAPPMVLLHALGERASDWAPVTPALAERYRVYAVDLRGHGDTDWPGNYSFQLMRDDAIGLLDHLGLRRVVLVGHSMGAMVAYLLTIARPDLVTRLVIEDAAPPSPRNRPLPSVPAGPLEFDWPVVPAIVTQVNQGDPETWELLSTITAPTLIIGGGPESHIPGDRLEAAAARIPACDLITIPAGHNIHTTSPAEFQATVLTWLATEQPG